MLRLFVLSLICLANVSQPHGICVHVCIGVCDVHGHMHTFLVLRMCYRVKLALTELMGGDTAEENQHRCCDGSTFQM